MYYKTTVVPINERETVVRVWRISEYDGSETLVGSVTDLHDPETAPRIPVRELPGDDGSFDRDVAHEYGLTSRCVAATDKAGRIMRDDHGVIICRKAHRR